MKLDILLSTMHMKSADEIRKLNISGNCIVVNQCDEDKVETIQIEETCAKQTILYTKERGLSKSRNMALFASNADICKLSDDDLNYEEDYEKRIIQAFIDYPKADVICFHVTRPERKKPTFLKPKKLNYITSLKVCSVEIAFRKERVEGIQFREDFGTGSKQYLMGEENIFLYDCLKKKLEVLYLPVTIGSLLDSESTWDTGFHKEFFVSRGANYYAMSRLGSHALIWQYALRKTGEYKATVSFMDAIKSMYQGRNQLKKKNVLLIGDDYSTTGPAIVTRDYISYLPSAVRHLRFQSKILRLVELKIKLSQCNIIMCSGISRQNIIAYKHAQKYNKKSVYLMHGNVAFENQMNQVYNPQLEALERSILERVDCIMTVSKCYGDWVKNNYPKYQHKVVEMTNGIDYRLFEKISEEDAKPFAKTDQDKKRVMSIGGGLPLKNIVTLCKAIKELIDEKRIAIELCVFGQENLDSQEIRSYDFVKDYGVVPHDQLLGFMRTADIYVQNSLYETFGLAPIEAGMMGCKLIISNKVGAKDTITELFALNEEQIITDPLDVTELKEAISRQLNSKAKIQSVTLLRKYETSIQKRSMELFQFLNQI